MLSTFFILNGLAMIASAHMIMKKPIPFNPLHLNNFPLDKDGIDFPCKQRAGSYDLTIDQVNVFPQGSSQLLQFQGSAVHAGGSCQISLTTDLQPSKSSVWRVIKSFEGGCPAKDQTGNMPGDADVIDPYTYNFTIPAEVAAGNYTLAWSWFNRSGNREMYMNCAPVAITGSGGSTSYLGTLPLMFEANIFGDDGCKTLEGPDLQFPDAGKDLDRYSMKDVSLLGPNSACHAQATAPPGGSYSPPPQTSVPAPMSTLPAAVSSPSAASSPTALAPAPTGYSSVTLQTKTVGSATASQPLISQPAVTPAPAPLRASQGPVRLLPSAAPSLSSAAPSLSSAAPSLSSAAPSLSSAAPSLSAAPSSPGSGSGSGSAFAEGSACTTEGQWNCIGGTSFQRCGSEIWSSVIKLPRGTTCTPGLTEDLVIASKKSKKSKRALRRAHRQHDHLHTYA